MDYPKKIILQTGRQHIELLDIKEALGEENYNAFCKAYEDNPDKVIEHFKRWLASEL